MTAAENQPPSALDRFLRLFTDVHAGEAGTALLLSLNVFLILTAYYVLKPVREALEPQERVRSADELDARLAALERSSR